MDIESVRDRERVMQTGTASFLVPLAGVCGGAVGQIFLIRAVAEPV